MRTLDIPYYNTFTIDVVVWDPDIELVWGAAIRWGAFIRSNATGKSVSVQHSGNITLEHSDSSNLIGIRVFNSVLRPIHKLPQQWDLYWLGFRWYDVRVRM